MGMRVHRIPLSFAAVLTVAACGPGAIGHGQQSTEPVDPRPSSGEPRPSETESPEPSPPVSLEPDGPMSGIVAAHNEHRARHCAPPLRWSARVADVAQRWADDLRSRGCAFEHSRGAYGENLMMFSPPGSRSPAYVADAWYREVASYDFSAPGFSMQTGHFTQLIWAGTTELGCGVTECNGSELWVCNYAPTGNMAGHFPENVMQASCASER